MEWQYIPKKTIEKKANSVIVLINPSLLKTPGVIRPLDCLAALDDKDGVVHEYCNFEDCNILGAILFIEKRIYLSNTLKREYSKKHTFTILHEIGHWVLHRDSFDIQNISCSLFADEPKPVIQCLNSEIDNGTTLKREEWQANYFAGCLSMPRDAFIAKFNERNPKPFYYRNQGELDELHISSKYLNTVDILHRFFECSKMSVEVRLKELNLVQLSEKQLF